MPEPAVCPHHCITTECRREMEKQGQGQVCNSLRILSWPSSCYMPTYSINSLFINTCSRYCYLQTIILVFFILLSVIPVFRKKIGKSCTLFWFVFSVHVEDGSLEVVSMLLQRRVQHDVSDFDNHLDDLTCDWSNPQINKLLTTLTSDATRD